MIENIGIFLLNSDAPHMIAIVTINLIFLTCPSHAGIVETC
jgi:hypothetical protein